jgi:hypothetical protein
MLIKVMIFVLISVIIVGCAGRQTQCQQVAIQNQTKRWDSHDEKALIRASERCGEIYPDAPCLKKFYKLDENRYSALCGAKND